MSPPQTEVQRADGGFVVVGRYNGAIYGVGATREAAIAEAQTYILEDVENSLRDWEGSTDSGFEWGVVDVLPCSKELRDSVNKRGGHEDWIVTNNGFVALEGDAKA